MRGEALVLLVLGAISLVAGLVDYYLESVIVEGEQGLSPDLPWQASWPYFIIALIFLSGWMFVMAFGLGGQPATSPETTPPARP